MNKEPNCEISHATRNHPHTRNQTRSQRLSHAFETRCGAPSGHGVREIDFAFFPYSLLLFRIFFLHPLPFPTVGFSQGLVPPPDGCTAKRSKNDSSRPQPTLHSDPSGSKPPENAVKTIQIHQIDLHRPYILTRAAPSLPKMQSKLSKTLQIDLHRPYTLTL